jgi:predicted enzyme related to lactoylglutathione lyase
VEDDLHLRLSAVTMDCQDVARAAGFWSALLRLPVREPLPGWRRLGPVPGGPLLTFQPVDRSVPAPAGVHVDLTTVAGEAAAARVVELGGRLLQEHRYEAGTVRVVADPEGHVFCLVEYRAGFCPS